MVKRTRFILYGALIVFACLFMVGTFLDEQINDALFHDKNTFGLIVSVIGTTPGYGVFSILGGGLLALGLRKDYKTWMRVLLIVGSAVCLGLSTYFAGREFFGPNGFYWVASRFWGYFIAFPAMCGLTYLGYVIFKGNDYKYLWIVILILIAAFAIALTAGVSLFKVIFHRPRFRAVMGSALDYYPWYERCGNYKELMEINGLAEEEFKSFPSGHAASSIGFPLFALFLPLFSKKYAKWSLPAFGCGLAFALLVMFSRLFVGAHYLSDVSMGSMITLVFFIVAFEVIFNNKKLNVSLSDK